MAGGYSVDIDTATHRKAFSRALLALLLLTLPMPIHSQGQFCPGERVSSFSCTTIFAHVWFGSALAGQCPSGDVISLSTAANLEGDTATCGIFNATVTSIMGGMLSSTISFTASSDLDGTEVVCRNATPADVESYPITIIAVGRVGNLRRSGPDTIQWDPPSGAAGCISSYIHVVAGGPGGTITNSTTSTMISLSAISGDLDTCDDNLRITVTAEVPSIGAVASSMSDPPFDPTSAFQPAAQEVDIVGPPTYAITDDSTVIQITIIASEVLDLFPDTFINVSYSDSQPSCGGSSRVVDDVAQVNISCLGETNVDFTAVLVDDPDCRSSSINLPQQSFPLINEGFQLTMTSSATSTGAIVTVPISDDVRVQDGSFDVVGNATQVSDNTMVITSEPATYPDNAVFLNLVPNVSYEFAIEIVSKASDRTVIGRFSITQSTQSSIGAIVGGVVGGIAALLVAVVVVVLVYWFCCRDKSKGYVLPSGSGGKAQDERELLERTRSAEAPPDEETAPTYADPNTIERQPASASQDVYTMVDKAKKAPKPEDQLQTYQTPESILREAAPATGELYTVPEAKKGSKKKKEATPAEYTEVDMKKKHQPPSGLTYSELNLPPSSKTPPSKPMEYTDIQPHS